MEKNTSGQGKDAVVPHEIKKWNWGAFIFSWLWGISNNTYRALWVLFPFVGIFMMFALGFKGSEWAWKYKEWESVEHFQLTQRKWAKAAVILFLFMIPIIFVMIFSVNNLIKESEPYKMSFEMAGNNPDVIKFIGSPIDSGLVSGNLKTSGPDGHANLSYKIEGEKGSGKVFVESLMKMGNWSINCLEVQMPDKSRTVIVQCK